MSLFSLPRRPLLAVGTLVLPLVALAAPVAAEPPPDDAVVTANRASGDISVIDGDDRSVVDYDLPGEAEPMYVSHDGENGLVWVGDRASSTVVAVDDETFEVVASVPVADGVFHQWLDESRDQLWVAGTAGATVTVVDTSTRSATTTITIPDDLRDAGATTHDVFVDGNHAFVSLVGADDGVVLRYSTKSFELTGRIDTGGDPHLFARAGRLFVASQEAGTVSSYVPATLRLVETVEVPAAHGIFVAGNTVFVTNIAGGGDDALWQLDRSLDITAEPVDTDAPVPHNVAVTADGTAFITHSGGASNAVSVIDPETGAGQLVTVGTNPFGLAVVD